MSLRSRLRALVRSGAEEALGAHIRHLTEGGSGAINAGRLLALANEGRDLVHLRDYGFRVSSQFGEDGIIQHLVAKVPGISDTFVEIGVEDYSESNTRFLADKDDWRGLIIDASDDAPAFLRRRAYDVRRSIDFRRAFVTAENVDDLLSGQPEELGLLSIDIDGMDYWVWRALSVVRPAIVVLEYQNTFGPTEEIVVPYDPTFDRLRAHPSGLYWGASLAAFERLGREKGYALLGTSDGPNVFFVREDRLGPLRRVTSAECYREARYRESRELDSRSPLVIGMAERRRAVAGCEVLDLRTGDRRTVGSFENL